MTEKKTWVQLAGKDKIRIAYSQDDYVADLKQKIKLSGYPVALQYVDFSELKLSINNQKLENGTKIQDLFLQDNTIIMVEAPTQITSQQQDTSSATKTSETPLSLDMIFDQFSEILSLVDKSIPQPMGYLSSNEIPFLNSNIQIPFYKSKNFPDIFQVKLESSFPSEKRAQDVINTLEDQHIFAIGVSGAGKSQLAFDLCKRKFSLYFDCNGGGEAKIPQTDIKTFSCDIYNANKLKVLSEKQDLCIFYSKCLIVSRLILLSFFTKNLENIQPNDWLLYQIYGCGENNNQLLSIYNKCKQCSFDWLNKAAKLLSSHSSLVILDEAQSFLNKQQYGLFYSYSERQYTRPLLTVLLHACKTFGFRNYISGTELSLISVSDLYSSIGNESSVSLYLNFDYLSPDPNVQPNVSQFLEYFLNFNNISDDLKKNIFQTLQGRPRFVASFILRLIKNYTSNSFNKESFFYQQLNDYKTWIISGLEPMTLCSAWNKLYESSIRKENKATDLFYDAFVLLVKSLFSSSSKDVNPANELASFGISMLSSNGSEIIQILREPLCKSAGLTFCGQKGIDICQAYVISYLPFESQGHLVEIIVALNIYKNKGKRISELFKSIKEFSESKIPECFDENLPDFKGIVVDTSRIIDSKSEWINLPEQTAGPDIVASSLIISLKTSKNQVTDEKCKIAIRTTDPYRLYFSKIGLTQGKESHSISNLRFLGNKQSIIRVRIEIPSSSPNMVPKNSFEKSDYWCIPYFDEEVKTNFNLDSAEILFTMVKEFYKSKIFIEMFKAIILENYETIHENKEYLIDLLKNKTLEDQLWKCFKHYLNSTNFNLIKKEKPTAQQTTVQQTTALQTTAQQTTAQQITAEQNNNNTNNLNPEENKTENEQTIENFPNYFYQQTILILYSRILQHGKNETEKNISKILDNFSPIPSYLVYLNLEKSELPILKNINQLFNTKEGTKKQVKINKQKKKKEKKKERNKITENKGEKDETLQKQERNKITENKGEKDETLQLLEKARKEKDNGNEFFKKGEIPSALNHYHLALLNLNRLVGLNEEEIKQMNLIKTQVCNNMTACYIKQRNYIKAIKSSNQVLQLEPNNIKGLFRRGKSYLEDGNLDSAERDLLKAQELDPEDKLIKKEIAFLQKKLKESDKKQQKFYSNMFSKLEEENHKEQN